MPNQLADKVLMIRPSNFGFNEETFSSNSFQNKPKEIEVASIQKKALIEFDNFVSQLKSLGVEVIVFEDFSDSQTPDSIFPNNWISMHDNGTMFIYPMMVSNRRKERRDDIIDFLVKMNNYSLVDLTASEKFETPEFLEGTGSMIFDHYARKIYAAISTRTSLNQLNQFAEKIDYLVVSFEAFGKQNEAIYHTNVMLAIGEQFAVIGLDTIKPEQVEKVKTSLLSDRKELIELTNEQVYNHFAGNMLQVKNKNEERIIVMSESAFRSLSKLQLTQLEKYNDHILSVPIPTIEKIGGGSARCMLAEVFKPV